MTFALEDRNVDSAGPAPAGHRIHFEDSPRRVRAVLGGVVIADSRRIKLLLETRHLPVYYFPMEDVRMDLLELTDRSTHCPYKGDASYWTVKVGDRAAENAVWGYRDPIPERDDIREYVAFYWNAMDTWYEEDEEVFVHARDPYKRVDVLHSSRHVRVVLAGETVADTRRPRLLFETSLPTRYYIPRLDIRMDLLAPTDTTTRCPYKGVASYWSVRIGDQVFKDVVWSYLAPVPECSKIERLMCFFNEKADMYVDGELMERPKTQWS
jgi:uncharacterized protein (DUF427 family)